jgi:hypothetical protein
MSNDNFGSFFKRQGLLAYNKIVNSITTLSTPVIEIKADEPDTNVDISIVPKGLGCFSLATPDGTTKGGDKRGARSVDLQLVRSSSNQVASGIGSFTAGQQNQAQGSGSVAMGNTNVATNTGSVALGSTNSVTGIGSIALGSGNTATANGSTAIGSGNTASASGSIATGSSSSTFGIVGRKSHNGSSATGLGICQNSEFTLKANPIDATPVVMTADLGAASTNNMIVLGNNSSYYCEGFIVVKLSTLTNSSVFKVSCLVNRMANAASTTIIFQSVTAISNISALPLPVLSADVTNGGLQILVTGSGSFATMWSARIDTVETTVA